MKNNAGGHNVEFNEILSFNKNLMESVLKVRVLDKDTLSDDVLGELDVNLNLQDLPADGESEQAMQFELTNKGKPAGKVWLTFSRKPAESVPAGAFSGALHCTVHKIDEFADTAGFMDR